VAESGNSASRAAWSVSSTDPIFIHGILPRSGTNFLWDLLLLHPDCGPARDPVREDLFLDQSDLLVEFAQKVRASWDPRWGSYSADIVERLCAGLGEGLVSFLWTDRRRRLVTKSPSVVHLDRFFTFFPQALLVILVRDGRSVAQSAMDTFGWSLERASTAWAQAGRTIEHFREIESGRRERWRVVRYEDLIDRTETEMRQLFEFLRLDPDRYDYDAARNLPVRGSSAFGRDGSNVHWQTVPKTASFAPKERWRSWPADRVERFDWLAGAQLVALGYEPARRRFTTAGALRHTVRDWRWRAAVAAARAIYRVRGRVALRSRIKRAAERIRNRAAR
jgi:protein-tyrosine sulfotransferase